MMTTIWVTQAIDEFGRMLGFEELDFDEHGLMQLEFAEFGVFGMEQSEGSLLTYLMRPMPRPDVSAYRRALQLCHYDESPLDWLQASLLPGNRLALTTRIPNEEVRLASLERTLMTLSELHDTIGSSTRI